MILESYAWMWRYVIVNEQTILTYDVYNSTWLLNEVSTSNFNRFKSPQIVKKLSFITVHV